MLLDQSYNLKELVPFCLDASSFAARVLRPEVCVGITQMLQKSISRFLTLGITLSIAIVLVFSAPRLRIGVFASLALTQEVG